jgi:hypothetical protein
MRSLAYLERLQEEEKQSAVPNEAGRFERPSPWTGTFDVEPGIEVSSDCCGSPFGIRVGHFDIERAFGRGLSRSRQAVTGVDSRDGPTTHQRY